MSDHNIAVLLSAGRHPVSGRGRRALSDARALDLALGLEGGRPHAIHAGDPDDPALRDYLGMGLANLAVLKTDADSDVLPALLEHLRDLAPDVILAGDAAEVGEGSGLLPYLLAEGLGLPLVAQIAMMTSGSAGAEVLQGLPRGQRRRLRVRGPFFAVAGKAAPPPRQVAFGAARRGQVQILEALSLPDREAADWARTPARPRPKRLKIVKGASAAERLAAATGQGMQGGQVIRGKDPRFAAEAIYNALVEEEVV